MLNTIIANIPSIKYFEFYGLNNYDSSVCQTITKDSTATTNTITYQPNNEALTVRYIVNTTKSNFTTGDIVFTPDITITEL
jgi:hypothetical protein